MKRPLVRLCSRLGAALLITALCAACGGSEGGSGAGPQSDLGSARSDVGVDDTGAADAGSPADARPAPGDVAPSHDGGDPPRPDQGPTQDGGAETPDSQPDAAGPVVPVPVPAGCNPLAASWDCLLPWPSDVFLVTDPALSSGRRLHVPEVALPHSPAGQTIDLPGRHPADGFSRLPAILALLQGPLDDSSLVFHTGDVSRSVLPDSNTLLIHADSGEAVVHFAELDPRSPDPARRALLLRPLAPLQPHARYVVALQGVRRIDGALARTPEGFRRLRDGEPSGAPALEALVERYEEQIFPVLATAGVQRATLQLAWDFTTRSETDLQQPLLALREDLMARLQATPPAAAVERVEEPVGDLIRRRIHGTLEVPLYVSHDGAGATLNRDEGGLPVAQGVAQVPFLIQVPHTAFDGTPLGGPARVLQFGHGFFAGRDESQGTFLRRQANEDGFLLVAVDWWGMSHPDMPHIMQTITSDPTESFAFVERLHQAMANNLALGYALRTSLTELPELHDPDGELLYDPEQHYLYGISQGHILGGTLLALSPHIDRAVLSSGGCGFQFMMFRSRPFLGFLFVVSQAVPDPLDQQKFAALGQQALDPIDPMNWAAQVRHAPLAGNPAGREVLMQVGLGDTSVPTLAAHVHARAMGLALLQPAARPVPGLPDAPAPHAGSALVELDYGVEPPLPGDYAEPPVAETPVHEAIRRSPEVAEQMDHFLRPNGQVINPCEGSCDPD